MSEYLYIIYSNTCIVAQVVPTLTTTRKRKSPSPSSPAESPMDDPDVVDLTMDDETPSSQHKHKKPKLMTPRVVPTGLPTGYLTGLLDSMLFKKSKSAKSKSGKPPSIRDRLRELALRYSKLEHPSCNHPLKLHIIVPMIQYRLDRTALIDAAGWSFEEICNRFADIDSGPMCVTCSEIMGEDEDHKMLCDECERDEKLTTNVVVLEALEKFGLELRRGDRRSSSSDQSVGAGAGAGAGVGTETPKTPEEPAETPEEVASRLARKQEFERDHRAFLDGIIAKFASAPCGWSFAAM